jgi:predicted HTH domain antitoxin
MASSETVTVTVELPRAFVDAMNRSLPELAQDARRWLVLAAFRDGQISAGKAAELLGLSKSDFIDLLDRYALPYLDRTTQEWAEEIAVDLPYPHRREP